MSYLVLARKYRPQTFDDVLAQEHITDTLKNAISADRVAHAYLFAGPRGIGKTSCARILAKALNCEKGPTVNPCGKCASCLDIVKGTSMDILEIDGASNRGIDEIRALRENVKFASNYGRYKIYIIDEVHMLTEPAFNALLKTLEEPPEHVKFILATTAPHKVPSTIISRCQRFDFKPISAKMLVEALSSICQKEHFHVEQNALYEIAKSAQGGFRDALSILDQLSAVNNKDIKSQDVYGMLGLVEIELMFELVDALAAKNCAQALQVLEKIIIKGKDMRQLAKALQEHFRHLMVMKINPQGLQKLLDYPVEIKKKFLEQSNKFSLPEILSAIDIFIEAQESARITESMRLSLEVAFAKLSYAGENKSSHLSGRTPSVSQPVSRGATKKPSSAPGLLANNKGKVDFFKDKKEDVIENEEIFMPAKQDVSFDGKMDFDRIEKMWDALTFAVSRNRMSIATFLQEGKPQTFENPKLTIVFPQECKFQKESLEEPEARALVEKIFSEKLQTSILVEYKIVEDFSSPVAEDTAVKDVLNVFKGKITNKWHNE
ncbi:MAG TPA: DNA polymerase III subunit gamma/tau [Candidatus Omnitrophota bacterium]|nr:DNA polymerase III subunit gamma/tau [Candidatus Omnitrophota bacterium]